MKSLFFVCIAVMTLCSLVIGQQNQGVIDPGAGISKTPSSVKAEIQQLMDLVNQARDAGQEPDPAWFERLDDLLGAPRHGHSLDQPRRATTVGESTRNGGETCASAFVIPALPFSESGSLGNTDDCAGRPYYDIFYTYTAVQSGNHTFDMCGSPGDTYMRLWTGGTCCGGTSVTDDNSCGSDFDPTVTINLTAGQMIYIECGRYQQSGYPGTYVFHANGPLTPPANDNCAGAVLVAANSQTMGTTANATVDTAPACGTAGTPTAPGVWFKVIGTGNTLTASLCNTVTTWDTKLSVFTGPCTSLGCVDGNDDACGNQSRVSWCSDAGVEYYILVHGYLAAFGNFRLDVLDDGVNCHFTCDTYLPCGTPAETEPNDVCPSQIDPLLIACSPDDTGLVEADVYGTVCPTTDHDIYHVVVPANTVMNIRFSGGENCDDVPASCVVSDLLNDNCTLLQSGSVLGWIITNTNTVPLNYYLDVHGNGNCVGRYKIATTCCPAHDYCADPILVSGGTEYTATVNTCCATSPLPFIYSQACGGALYAAGRAVIFRIHTYLSGHLQITATGGDAQLMVFTDCSNPTGTCVASSDTSIQFAEEISNLFLPAGTYFISVSRFGSDCGEVTLDILSDVILPAELTSFTAKGERNQVNIAWQTASETDNDRFEIERDGHIIARVPTQGNDPSGHTYTLTDEPLDNGRTYHYDLYCVDLNAQRVLLKSTEAVPREDGEALITQYALYQNYPNPFNPSTRVAFDLPEKGFVLLKIYNVLGQKVAEAVNGTLSAGHHIVTVDGSSLPSGIYLYRLEVSGFVAEKKMLLMK
jgi:hypothetical protein